MKEPTPAPWKWYWKLNEHLEADCGVYWELREGLAISVCRAPRYETKEQWEANAPLICAAQDLLEACHKLIVTAENAPPTQFIKYLDEAVKAAKQAIAKAEGDTL